MDVFTIALVASGFVAGMLVRRWWLLAVVALSWLAFLGWGLAARSNDPPSGLSDAWILALGAGLLLAVVLATALGIAAGRAVASMRDNRPRSTARSRSGLAARR